MMFDYILCNYYFSARILEGWDFTHVDHISYGLGTCIYNVYLHHTAKNFHWTKISHNPATLLAYCTKFYLAE